MTTRRSLISGAAALATFQALGARAQGIPGLAIPPGLIAGGVPLALAFRAAYAGTDNVASQTIASVDFGAANSTRSILIIGGYWCSSSQQTITSATIGGVGATILVNGTSGAFALIASVPLGSTGSLALTMSSLDQQGLRFAAYRLTNLQSQTPVTISTIGAGGSASIARPAGATIVYAGYKMNTGAASVSGLTIDDAVSGHVEAHSGVNAGAADSVSVTVTASAPYADTYLVFK